MRRSGPASSAGRDRQEHPPAQPELDGRAAAADAGRGEARKGELAGRLLADFAADVVRVEPPGGARSRRIPPFHGATSLYFAHRNANKRGIVLDLESERDRGRLRDLCARADVLIESFAPGTLAGLGLAPADLALRNPQLVALSITDFGQDGPYRDWVATDATLEAIGGQQVKAGVAGRPSFAR